MPTPERLAGRCKRCGDWLFPLPPTGYCGHCVGKLTQEEVERLLDVPAVRAAVEAGLRRDLETES